MILLHTNDLHGKLTPAKAELIRKLREDADLLVDSGDAVKAGNLGIPLLHDPTWDLLKRAGCEVGTIGNRESHLLESAFESKISGAGHRLICANMLDKVTRIPVLPGSVVLDVAGLKVGFIGVMVPMVTDRMATKVASAYIWEQPVPAATKVAKALRSDVDCLIAITHIGLRHDRELAVACPALDLILGGHSHSTLTEPERIGKVMICQGGSHGRFVGRYEWLADRGLISAELVPLA